MPCSVPHCNPSGQTLLLKFPRSHFLCERWLEAIQLGTGIDLPTGYNPLDAEICQQHFKQIDGGYCEPVMFHNRSMGLEVHLSSCKLCLRFHFTETIVTDSIDDTIGNAPLGDVLKVGFGIQLSRSDFLHGICQECLVRLDLYVTMRKQFSLAAKRSRKMCIFIQGEKGTEPEMNGPKSELVTMDWKIKEEEKSFAEKTSSTVEIKLDNENYNNDIGDDRPAKKDNKALHQSTYKPRKQPRFKKKKPTEEKVSVKKQQVVKRTSGRYKGHLKSLNDRKCYICVQLFETRAELFTHILDHVGANLHCGVCNESFPNITKYNRHLAKHDSTVRPIKCDHCEIRFAEMYGKRRHEKLHHNVEHPVKPYTCNAEKKVNYTCQHCGRQCKSLSGLREHEDTHAGVKRFQCITCNKLFPTKTNLERHHLIHTGEKPFKCSVCGRGFRQSPLLKDHLRLHTGETPYPCGRCELRFSSSNGLRRHEVNVHGLSRVTRTKPENMASSEKTAGDGNDTDGIL